MIETLQLEQGQLRAALGIDLHTPQMVRVTLPGDIITTVRYHELLTLPGARLISPFSHCLVEKKNRRDDDESKENRNFNYSNTGLLCELLEKSQSNKNANVEQLDQEKDQQHQEDRTLVEAEIARVRTEERARLAVEIARGAEERNRNETKIARARAEERSRTKSEIERLNQEVAHLVAEQDCTGKRSRLASYSIDALQGTPTNSYDRVPPTVHF